MSTDSSPDAVSFRTLTSAEVADQTLILIETAAQWYLAPKLDPELEPGTMFLYDDRLWTVTWDSVQGFGEITFH